MIKFFRKIRQNLLTENKTSKYFKYAIGEIILVVIGILIALQINNWNEQQKIRTYEITMLKEVSAALETDLALLDRNIPYLENALNSFCKLAIIKNDITNSKDSLLFHVEIIHEYGFLLNLNTSPYEAIKSGGMDKISNLYIRNQLSKLYGEKIQFAQTWINEIFRAELFNKMELISKLFYVKAVSRNGRVASEIIIENPDIIDNNKDFDKLLMTSWPLSQTILRLKSIRDEMLDLKKNIAKEIK
ncbi:DUF6090 family protein [Polaribacter sp.]|uniref:DUF6090 family protein n=1 Tax=Polaribacter sp. TaxID=1920175 RepID=UPI00404746B5